MYLIADKVLTDFRHQSVRSDIHTGCGPGAASFLMGWRLGVRQYLLSVSEVKAITQSGYKTRLIVQGISAGRAFTNGSGAVTSPSSIIVYLQTEWSPSSLSAVPTEMWGLLFLAREWTKKLILRPVCKANHSVTHPRQASPDPTPPHIPCSS